MAAISQCDYEATQKSILKTQKSVNMNVENKPIFVFILSSFSQQNSHVVKTRHTRALGARGLPGTAKSRTTKSLTEQEMIYCTIVTCYNI